MIKSSTLIIFLIFLNTNCAKPLVENSGYSEPEPLTGYSEPEPLTGYSEPEPLVGKSGYPNLDNKLLNLFKHSKHDDEFYKLTDSNLSECTKIGLKILKINYNGSKVFQFRNRIEQLCECYEKDNITFPNPSKEILLILTSLSHYPELTLLYPKTSSKQSFKISANLFNMDYLIGSENISLLNKFAKQNICIPGRIFEFTARFLRLKYQHYIINDAISNKWLWKLSEKQLNKTAYLRRVIKKWKKNYQYLTYLKSDILFNSNSLEKHLNFIEQLNEDYRRLFIFSLSSTITSYQDLKKHYSIFKKKNKWTLKYLNNKSGYYLQVRDLTFKVQDNKSWSVIINKLMKFYDQCTISNKNSLDEVISQLKVLFNLNKPEQVHANINILDSIQKQYGSLVLQSFLKHTRISFRKQIYPDQNKDSLNWFLYSYGVLLESLADIELHNIKDKNLIKKELVAYLQLDIFMLTKFNSLKLKNQKMTVRDYKKTFIKLYNDFGITYFSRYPIQTLVEMPFTYNNINSNKPYAVLLGAKADHNGAFNNMDNQIKPISTYYDVAVAEIDNRNDFNKIIKKIAKFRKIDLLIISGHGRQKNITFSEKPNGLFSTDYIPKIYKIQNYFNTDLKVVLQSCSTGRTQNNRINVQNALCDALNAKIIFAPDDITSLPNFEFYNGELKIVNYDSQVGSVSRICN